MAGPPDSPRGSSPSFGLLQPWDPAGQRQHARREPRLPLGGVKPIGLCLGVDGAAPGAWVAADVLDISQGGMALLVVTAPPLALDQPLLLDFSNHPDAGLGRLRARLRWVVASPLAITLGVQFEQPLAQLPGLAPVDRS